MSRSATALLISLFILAGCASGKTRESIRSNSERIVRMQEKVDSMKTSMGEASTKIEQVDAKISTLTRKVGNTTSDLGAPSGPEESSLPAPSYEPEPVEAQTVSEEDASAYGTAPDEAPAAVSNSAAGEGRQVPKKPVRVPGDALSIKVLSGRGNLAAAESMARRLYSRGYPVHRLDIAPSRFDSDIVYYAEGHEDTAREMARYIGPGTDVKPLTWRSAFHIIVVSAD